jgi:hypothetical protein
MTSKQVCYESLNLTSPSLFNHSSQCNTEEMTYLIETGNSLKSLPQFAISLAFLISPIIFYAFEWWDNEKYGYLKLKNQVLLFLSFVVTFSKWGFS